MTDKRSYLTVTLTADLRDDDCDAVVNAILQLRFVAGVTRGQPVDGSELVARSRMKMKLATKIMNLLEEPI